MRFACLSKRLSVGVLFALCLSFAFSIASIAQTEKHVTVIIDQTSANSFDIEKLQQKISASLSKNGIYSVVFQPDRQNDASKATQPFSVGESAKIFIKIAPGRVIEGAHFSSFPVTVEMAVDPADKESRIDSIIESARSQHTNSLAGLTSAISKAINNGLTKIGPEIARLTPFEKSSELETSPSDSGTETTNQTQNSSNTDSDKVAAKQTKQRGRSGGYAEPVAECDQNSLRSSLLVNPSTIVARGESISVISCYQTDSSEDQQIRIRTSIESKFGAKKTLLNSEDYVLGTGFWKSTFNFAVPMRIEPGDYTLAQAIYRQGRVEYLSVDIVVK